MISKKMAQFMSNFESDLERGMSIEKAIEIECRTNYGMNYEIDL